MIRHILIIGANTFKETIRNKILYNILLFVCLIIGLSIAFGEWSVFARIQVMEDFGLAAMSVSGLLLAIFIGVAMLGKELTSKTVYLMASKPIHRSSILLGKFFGLAFTISLNLSIMSFFFLTTILLCGGQFKIQLVSAIVLTGCEMILIVAVALFFSTITNPTLSALSTIALYIAGHLNELTLMKKQIDPQNIFFILQKSVNALLPNLEIFNIRAAVIYGSGISIDYLLLGCLYCCLYSCMLLLISCAIFSRKDL